MTIEEQILELTRENRALREENAQLFQALTSLHYYRQTVLKVLGYTDINDTTKDSVSDTEE